MALMFYRYISHNSELDLLRAERRIRSTNPVATGTWFTTKRYDNPMEAQRRLALSKPPTHRIGPIPEAHMPTFTTPRTVAPAAGQPGGGDETFADGEVLLSGLWSFGAGDWEF